ncbi:sensor histidine kinase [Halobacterium noricense]|uniref:sensor histidine kinase n=1 Tax=Halobacterium noricense TaxID=223182 RepID=UPI001E2C6BF6|nr:ATP-binding protein [Halobacterium noricense]UHH26328.1 ATP-binding protein [Halobacterium noricense]
MPVGDWSEEFRSRTIRVLHADSDETFASLTASYLERGTDRFEVTHTVTREDTVDALSTADVDCVVSAYTFPDGNGIELLKRIREAHPRLPFILYTGKGSEEIASDAISAGVTDYIQKRAGAEQYEVLANRIENAVEKCRSERELADQNRRLATLITNLPGMVYRCENDPGWPMEFVGGECEQLSGYDAAALERGDVRWGEDVIHPDDRGSVWATVQTAIADEQSFEVTYRIRTADGDRRHVWERGRGVPDENSDVVAIEGFITDVTEHVERERELRRQRNRLDEFASIVSHDLRNPLNVADGRLELARDDCNSEHLDDVAAAHDRMAALIDDLLALARSDAAITDPDRVSLHDVATDCWRSVETPTATLRVDGETTVFADRSQLRRLFGNLFRNAVEHGSTDPQNAKRSEDAVEHGSAQSDDCVTVRVGDLDDGFYVEDDGPGIPAGDRERVFEYGYSTDDRGTGIGLSIVAELVDAHGWSIEITDGETGGTRFEITGVETAD